MIGSFVLLLRDFLKVWFGTFIPLSVRNLVVLLEFFTRPDEKFKNQGEMFKPNSLVRVVLQEQAPRILPLTHLDFGKFRFNPKVNQPSEEDLDVRNHCLQEFLDHLVIFSELLLLLRD